MDRERIGAGDRRTCGRGIAVRLRGAGLPAWLVQRASAVYMLFFIAYLLTHFAFDPPDSFHSWRGWIAGPGVSLATGAFFCALLAHAGVGVRDVIMDYVRPVAARAPALAVLAASLIAIAAWIAQILLRSRG
jgi:succinate dehydrogenase / fumarate reductase, membrane anchor subunit